MVQPAPLQWWEIIVGMLSIPASIIGLIYSYILIKKTLLDVKVTKLEIAERERKLPKRKKEKDSSKNSKKVLFFDDILTSLLSPFSPEINDTPSKLFHQFLGVILEFVFLCGFLYTTIGLETDYAAMLYWRTFPDQSPLFLQNLTVRIIFSSVGLIFYLAILLMDINGATNILGREFKNKRLYTIAVSGTFYLYLLLELMVAASRFSFVSSNNQVISMLEIITLLGQNLIIIPLLMSILFSSRGLYIIVIALAFIVYIAKRLAIGYDNAMQ